jgi:hypothetical protein
MNCTNFFIVASFCKTTITKNYSCVYILLGSFIFPNKVVNTYLLGIYSDTFICLKLVTLKYLNIFMYEI